jgi:hypothetical protein
MNPISYDINFLNRGNKMTLPSNLNLIYPKPHSKNELRDDINPEHWLSSPESWDRSAYVSNLMNLIGSNPSLAITSKLFMLASQVEIFIACQLHIKEHGLTTIQNNGVTTGQNPHVKIADVALYRAVQLMKTLELDRMPAKNTPNPKYAALIAGPRST